MKVESFFRVFWFFSLRHWREAWHNWRETISRFSKFVVAKSRKMFKKLKDKIAEEVKQSPARFQEIINSAQVSQVDKDRRMQNKIKEWIATKTKKKQIKLVSVNKLLLVRPAIRLFTYASSLFANTITHQTTDYPDCRQLLARRARATPTRMLMRVREKIRHQQLKISFRSRKMTRLRTVRWRMYRWTVHRRLCRAGQSAWIFIHRQRKALRRRCWITGLHRERESYQTPQWPAMSRFDYRTMIHSL